MSNAPYRADHVGSLLRPATVKAARKSFLEEKSIGEDDLRDVEDQAVEQVVAMQKSAGLKAVTDGEYRRSFWHYDFMGALDGLDLEERDEGVQFAGVKLRPIFPVITGELDFPDNHPMLEHYRFVAGQANKAAGVEAKISIPGPSCCHFRTEVKDSAPERYQDAEVLFADIAQVYKKAVARFYEAGCRYLQMDDIFFAYLCDEKHRADKRAAGLDPDWLIGEYARMMETAIADRPADMKIGMHLCRGNFRSTHAAEGAYDPIADVIFNQTDVDIYFMEYDTDRAGGLAPLKYLPAGKKRVLPGFITTKKGDLETVESLQRKFDAAGKYADIAQLGIAPQCGFASTEEGNTLSEDDQRRKLELVVKTADAIWGGVDK